MKLPLEIRERFRRYGRAGGRKRAARMSAAARRSVATRAATARWLRRRFGSSSFEALGLPGGRLVDTGLGDLADGRTSVESLVVSIAAPRLRREGIPLARAHELPEDRLYDLLSRTAAGLAHARYGALLREVASFADACRHVRRDGGRRAS